MTVLCVFCREELTRDEDGEWRDNEGWDYCRNEDHPERNLGFHIPINEVELPDA